MLPPGGVPGGSVAPAGPLHGPGHRGAGGHATGAQAAGEQHVAGPGHAPDPVNTLPIANRGLSTLELLYKVSVLVKKR